MKMNNDKVIIFGMMLMTLISLEGLALAYYTGYPMIAIILSFGAMVFNYNAKVSLLQK